MPVSPIYFLIPISLRGVTLRNFHSDLRSIAFWMYFLFFWGPSALLKVAVREKTTTLICDNMRITEEDFLKSTKAVRKNSDRDGEVYCFYLLQDMRGANDNKS